MSREWGIHPGTENLKCWWGARAIVTHGNFELLRDRQSGEFDCDNGTQFEFVTFINAVIIPELEKAVKKCATKRTHKQYENGVVLEFDDRNSGGYLYIGVWLE